jgi:predicted aspartyl protease
LSGAAGWWRALVVALACAMAAPAWAQGHEIPFEIGGGGHVVVPVTINGIKGKAILDNGVPFTTLDSAFAKRAGLKELATAGGLAMRAVTGRRMVEAVTLDIGGASSKVEPALLDLSAVVAADGEDIFGIIGGEVFRRYPVEINFDARKVVFHDRAAFVAPSDKHLVRAANNMNSGKLFVPIQIEGDKVTSAMLDLGMPFAVLLAERSQPEAWTSGKRAFTTGNVGTATTGETFKQKTTKETTATTINLGPHKLTDVPVTVSNVGLGPISFPAIVGVGLLSRFNVTMDVTTTRLWLEPGTTFGTPFARAVQASR